MPRLRKTTTTTVTEEVIDVAPEKETKPKSNITFLLDRSQSMEICKDATIEGFNGYLATLQREKGADIRFTFLQFDAFGGQPFVQTIHDAVPVKDARHLFNDTYRPRGSTPLIDAAMQAIHIVEASVKPGEKVVIVFQTDGQENCSRTYSWSQLNALVKAKQEIGWEFNFMGAGIDAYKQSALMGVNAVHTMSYDHHDLRATREAFHAQAQNSANFSAGASASTQYSQIQKTAARDKFDPLAK